MFYLNSKTLAIFAMALSLALGGMCASKAYAADEKKPEAVGAKDEIKTHYVKVPPLLLPVMGDNGVEQIVSIVVSIEATSQDSATGIADVVPKLSDAYLTDLYGSLDRREHMKNGVIDVVYIKQRLTTITTKIAGQDNFRQVLIQGVAQHQS